MTKSVTIDWTDSNITLVRYGQSGPYTDTATNGVAFSVVDGITLYVAVVTNTGTKVTTVNVRDPSTLEIIDTITPSAASSTQYTFTYVIDTNVILDLVTDSTTTYTIVATAGTGGSISPSGNVVVTSGSNKTFTITSDTGYKIDEIDVDGSPITL